MELRNLFCLSHQYWTLFCKAFSQIFWILDFSSSIEESYFQRFQCTRLLKYLTIQVHQDKFMLNVKLQLFALIAKQPAFHQLRSVEQLGYITVLMHRYASPGVCLAQVVYYISCKFLSRFLLLTGNNSYFFYCRNDSGIRGVQFIIQSTVKV